MYLFVNVRNILEFKYIHVAFKKSLGTNVMVYNLWQHK